MTFHVALASAAGAVMVSDSQGSTAASEVHGFQKQLVGDDYVIGAAGSMLVIEALLEDLATGARTSSRTPTRNARLESDIRRFLDEDLVDDATTQIQVVVARPIATGFATQLFFPAVFRRFGKERPFAAIGSGAQFAQNAMLRDAKLGIAPPNENLADLFLAAESLADAADESLTVDDRLLVGILSSNGRSYVLGDSDVHVVHAASKVRDQWFTVAQRFQVIRHLARAYRGEAQTAHQTFSQIRSGPLSPPAQHALLQSAAGLQRLRQQMQKHLEDYFAWYDGLLGR